MTKIKSSALMLSGTVVLACSLLVLLRSRGPASIRGA